MISESRQEQVAWVLLAAGIVATVSMTSARAFGMPWYWNSEEIPYAQEALRFLSGDFRQQFFDIPGTPFMLLGAGLLRLAIGPTASPFEHLDLLLKIFRVLTGLAFAGACACIFLMLRRFASRWAALFATLVIAFHPIVGQTLHHVRIEPVALLLVAASILTWLRAIETGQRSLYAVAGLIAGLTMAARFQLLLAALPVFLLYALWKPTIYERPKLVDIILFCLFSTVALAGGVAAALFLGGRLAPGPITDVFAITGDGVPFARASGVLVKLWIVVSLFFVATAALAVFPLGRKLLVTYSRSSFLTLSAWFPVGLLIGAPTLLTSSRFFLSSVEMFVARNAYVPEYQDTAAKIVGLYLIGKDAFRELFSLTGVGETGVLFTLPLLIVFTAAFLGRKGPLFWFAVLGCAIGLASQFGKIQGSRHILGWLPWFAVILAVGADTLARLVPSRGRAAVSTVAAVGILGFVAARTVAFVSSDFAVVSSRLPALSDVQKWIRAETPDDIAVFYTCCSAFTEDAVLGWMAGYGVRSPVQFQAGSPWFGARVALANAGDGILVITRNEYEWAYIDYFKKTDPGNVVEPHSDPHFRLLKTFPIGNNDNVFEIFAFNFTGETRRTSGGIQVVSASYGANCRPGNEGNVTSLVRRYCNRKDSCQYPISVGFLGDPAPQCAKDFLVVWNCDGPSARRHAIPAEAHGQTIRLECPAAPTDRP